MKSRADPSRMSTCAWFTGTDKGSERVVRVAYASSVGCGSMSTYARDIANSASERNDHETYAFSTLMKDNCGCEYTLSVKLLVAVEGRLQ